MLSLLELEQCVKHVYYELSQYTNGASKKYFVSFLRQACIITNKRDASNTLHKFMIKILL